MSRKKRPAPSQTQTSANCHLDVSLTSREWKKAYFGDRPPRLSIKLRNPPASLNSLTLRAFTSFVGEVPVITTKKKTTVCSRKSDELRVKQMQNQTIKCMKSWSHCGCIRGLETVEGVTGETVFRCSTGKALLAWIAGVRANEDNEGIVFLKPDDVKMHLSLHNGVLTLKENPNGSGNVVKQWNVLDRKGKPAISVQKYFKRVVLDRSNDFSAVVSFAFHTGRYGAQVFNIEPQGPNPPCGAYESPIFSVTSCNRHPPRSPLLQAQEDAALAARRARAQQQHQQMLQHQARQQIQRQQRLQQQQQQQQQGIRLGGGLDGSVATSLGENGHAIASRVQQQQAAGSNRKRGGVAGGGANGSFDARRGAHGFRPENDRSMDKKTRRRTHSYVGLGGERVHRDQSMSDPSPDSPGDEGRESSLDVNGNGPFFQVLQQRQPRHFQSHPPAAGNILEDQISRLQGVSFSDDSPGGRTSRLPSSLSQTSLSDLHEIPSVSSSGSLASLGFRRNSSLEDFNQFLGGATTAGPARSAWPRQNSNGEDDVVSALFALNDADGKLRPSFGTGPRVARPGRRGSSNGRSNSGADSSHTAFDGPPASNLGTTSFKSPADWLPDASVTRCCTSGCPVHFSLLNRRHHCRVCGKIFCKECCPKRKSYFGNRVCGDCANTIPGAEGGAATKAIGLVAGAHQRMERERQMMSQSAPAPAGSWDFDSSRSDSGRSDSGRSDGGRSERRLSGSDLFAMGLNSGTNGTLPLGSRMRRSGSSNTSLDLMTGFGSRSDSGNSFDGGNGDGSPSPFSTANALALAVFDDDDDTPTDSTPPMF